MRIREAAISDVNTLAQIHVASWRTSYRGIMPDDLLDNLSVNEFEQIWYNNLHNNDRVNLVCQVEDQVVGWASLGVSRDDDALSTKELYGIYLFPNQYRRGYGSALWEAVLQICAAQGATRITLWVLYNNVNARHFYEQMGCSLEKGVIKEVERFGVVIPEVRYSRAIFGDAT
ncbi:GCN5-related N-acetyltransferase [Gloeocapsa sp. PCC 7428]|uniref:GNAT family N-acetyltransferase n=1 Tax=Gloeocapsa sp. PCC 7428 TaxID=1173026 RepID=UPI0002A5D268|nr:GNAT family N-acetyltransferase [Gloeocapsa sp. PCC 7428]AFZ33298.1 GCN5-related N-acetyltransferase [Gloeocapsa sp. PCC 7428]